MEPLVLFRKGVLQELLGTTICIGGIPRFGSNGFYLCENKFISYKKNGILCWGFVVIVSAGSVFF